MYAPRRYRIDEGGVIALVLIGVRLSEGRDRAVERVGGAKVAGDCGRVAGSGMGAGQRPGAQPGVQGQV